MQLVTINTITVQTVFINVLKSGTAHQEIGTFTAARAIRRKA